MDALSQNSSSAEQRMDIVQPARLFRADGRPPLLSLSISITRSDDSGSRAACPPPIIPFSSSRGAASSLSRFHSSLRDKWAPSRSRAGDSDVIERPPFEDRAAPSARQADLRSTSRPFIMPADDPYRWCLFRAASDGSFLGKGHRPAGRPARHGFLSGRCRGAGEEVCGASPGPKGNVPRTDCPSRPRRPVRRATKGRGSGGLFSPHSFELSRCPGAPLSESTSHFRRSLKTGCSFPFKPSSRYGEPVAWSRESKPPLYLAQFPSSLLPEGRMRAEVHWRLRSDMACGL
ncbi:hypothetical protein AAFF_G00035530 [Aldrovandia affinis]|uniref:Uncharacterized protein n=1 Tax=Aldrovandia affinis TaxID=143900 RepID=A0AAD7WFG9_9TELE|nr:hypothetical protein AAFF_G00035530 [Aldrovandia affinis]